MSDTPRRTDLADRLVVVGFLGFTVGIALQSVSWAAIIAGGLLCTFGLVASWRQGGPRGPRS